MAEKIAKKWDVIVVGGGPAGLAAALAARENGAATVLLLERNDDLGGILNQCIHNGFGLHHFKQELTGPEYAGRFIAMLPGSGVQVLCGAMVLHLAPGRVVHAIHSEQGYLELQAGAVVLAMGCRERTRGAIAIPGTRPAGILTAGAAQLYMNIEGFSVGRRAVVLGSGDIGLIMARRLTLEGAQVLGVYEVMPYSGGLARNKVQCLDDYGIPLYLSHTVIDIRGDKRLEQVVVAQVDEDRRPLPGSEQVIDCDTLLLSVGLIPENELSRQAGIPMDARTGGPVVYENMETQLPGVFACGNVAHVHDLVDFVTAESQRAGAAAGVRSTSFGLRAERGNKVNPRPAKPHPCGACAPQEPAKQARRGWVRSTSDGNSEGIYREPDLAEPSPPGAGEALRAGGVHCIPPTSPCIQVLPQAGVAYTVPQKIRPENVGKSVEIFFRAAQPFGASRVLVADDRGEVASFKRDFLAPGEMEKITLPAALLQKVAGGCLRVAVREEGAP